MKRNNSKCNPGQNPLSFIFISIYLYPAYQFLCALHASRRRGQVMATSLTTLGGMAGGGGTHMQTHMDPKSTEVCLCVAAGTRTVSSSDRIRKRTEAVQPQPVF